MSHLWPSELEIVDFLKHTISDGEKFSYSVIFEETSGTTTDILVVDQIKTSDGSQSKRLCLQAPKAEFKTKKEISAELVYQNIAELWPFLQSKCVSVPQLIAAVGCDSIFRRPCHILQWIEGSRLCDIKVHGERASKLLKEVARAAANLHSITASQLGERLAEKLHISPEVKYKFELSLLNKLNDYEDILNRHISGWKEIRELAVNAFLDDRGETLTHGDFYPGNMLIDENGLAGIIDWDTASLTDPGRDLGLYLMCRESLLGVGDGRQMFLDEYSKAGGNLRDIGTFLSAYTLAYLTMEIPKETTPSTDILNEYNEILNDFHRRY